MINDLGTTLRDRILGTHRVAAFLRDKPVAQVSPDSLQRADHSGIVPDGAGPGQH